MKFDTKIFIEKSQIAHGSRYDYSKTKYVNKKSKVIITCKIHGDFEQVAYCHYYFKQGCPKCKKNKKLTTKEFIEKSQIIHNYRYDYPKTKYVNSYTKVEVFCKIHGDFQVRPADHIHKKCGCSLCNLGYKKNNKITNEEFINKSQIIHDYRYDYSKTKYTNSRSKVIITCLSHGDFEQKAESHTRGRGCPNCKKSKGEIAVEKILKNQNISYEKQKVFKDCKNILTLPFDFYLPKYNVCIEFDGIQHFEPVKRFGGINSFEKCVKLDQIKNKYCEDNNIKLFRISYKDNINEKMNQITNLLNF